MPRSARCSSLLFCLSRELAYQCQWRGLSMELIAAPESRTVVGLHSLGSLPQSESHFRAPASDIRSAVVIFMYFHFGIGECFLYIEIRKYKEEEFGSLGNIQRGKEVLRVV